MYTRLAVIFVGTIDYVIGVHMLVFSSFDLHSSRSTTNQSTHSHRDFETNDKCEKESCS